MGEYVFLHQKKAVAIGVRDPVMEAYRETEMMRSTHLPL
jgi:hypothetical protein